MKGSIIERGDALRIKVCLGKNPATGKYDAYYETFHGNTTEARKRLRELLTELDKGTFIRPGKVTLAEYLNSWLTDNIKPNLSANTFASYSIMCNTHITPSIGKIPLVDLKPQHLTHLYAGIQADGLNRTAQLVHATLHKALQDALKGGLLSRNVAEAVDSPKIQRREMHTMNESDMHLFLEMARNGDYYTLFYLLLFTGMRRNEALALRWEDVDLLLCQLSISRSVQFINNTVSFKSPKTARSRRMIALSPSTVAVL